MPTIDLLPYEDVRPELAVLNFMRTQPFDAQEEAMTKLRDTSLSACLRCRWVKERANELYMQHKYYDAIDKYITAMREILPEDFELPAKEYINEKYLSYVIEGPWAEQLDLVECCDGIARCYLELGMLLEETEVLYINQRLGSKPDDLPFINVHLPIENHFTFRMRTCNLYSKILYDLGNTASSTFFAHRTMSHGASVLPDGHPRIEKLRRESGGLHKAQLRHPEPKFVDRWTITQPTLQVRGAWTKLQTAGGPAPQSRLAFSCWIWRSKLYVTGGRHWTIAPHVDLWCLNLEVSEKKWRRLPDPRGVMLNQTIKVWDNKAWMFIGRKEVYYFDLIEEKWKSVMTKLPGGKWPYYQGLSEYCMEIFEDVMYVFGGNDNLTELGTNIFMALDLRTLTWAHLGGTSFAKATNTVPMLRRFASSWVVPEQKRLYIAYGNICRQAALYSKKQYGNEEDYNHEDIWSYDIPGKMWRRERIRGNFPSPRTEMACTYNPMLDRVCVYGGYNASTSSLLGNRQYTFAYYGDTFVQDPTTGIWQHVLTRGFPSYRAQSQLLVDEDTGRMYLYGGYTNSEYVPSKHVKSRSFGDVWQLSIDMPGGCFSEADLERDLRSPKMGPWARCFTCGAVGDRWRKCGGSCGGKYVFCSTECLKDGWKEHKESHGCRKV